MAMSLRSASSILLIAALLTVSATACQAPSSPPGTETAVAGVPPSGQGRIRGVITDTGVDFAVQQAGGKPVGDAVVYLDNRPDIKTRTAADGSFELAGVPVGEHFVVAQKNGADGEFKVRARATIASPEQVADIQSLVLRRTGSVTGVVQAEGSASMIGTDVFIAGSTLIAKSKDNGAFALIGVAEGNYRVTASRPGFEPLTLEVEVKAGRASTLNLTLKPLDPSIKVAAVSGTVSGEAGPLAGAMVSLAGASGIGSVTDEAGRFTLGNVPDGEYQLQVFRAGYKLRTFSARVAVDPANDKTRQVDMGGLKLESEFAGIAQPEAVILIPTPQPTELPPVEAAPAATATPGPSATPTPGAAATAAPTAAPSTEVFGTPAPGIPGTLVEQTAYPSGSLSVGAFGLDKDGVSSKFAQPFVAKRNGKITALAMPIKAAQGYSSADTVLAVYAAAENGQPTGAALGSVSLPKSRIVPVGFGDAWVAAEFASPFSVSNGARYVAVLTCQTSMVAVVLNNQAVSGGPALGTSRTADGEIWYSLEQVPDLNGYVYAAFRLYME